LKESIINGKVSGEVAVTYENRDFDGPETEYFQNTGYSVGSFALKYETAEWNNLNLTSKFRTYTTLFEDDTSSITGNGRGDSSERFYEDGNNNHVDLEEFFLTYTPLTNISVNVGRQFIKTDWINNTQDAIRINGNFGKTSLDAIWSLREGRISAKDHRPMSKTNNNKGVYKLDITHKFNETISVGVYDAFKPDVRNFIGTKVDLNTERFSFGAHYVTNKEDDKSIEDSNLLHLSASTSIAGFYPFAGYIKIGDAYFPGWDGIAGETLDPMEEGDFIYEKDAETFYLGIDKSIGDLNTTLLYGQTEWLDGSNKLDMNETTLWLGYSITKDLNADLGYTIVNMGNNTGYSDYDQLNVTLKYSY
jgi:hypothetical protein